MPLRTCEFPWIEWSKGLGTDAEGPSRRVYLRDEHRTDFAALYTQEELHAGLVIIVPNVPPAQQRALFQAALSHIAGRDLINAALEVDIGGATIICREYPYPVF
jgi:hypothetical protein